MGVGYISRRSILQAGMLGLGLGIGQFKQIAHADAAGDIVLAWNNATLQAIRVVRPGVTVVARALAIVHTCIYDAWAVYDDFAVGTSSRGIVQRRPSSEQALVNKQEAISYAAYRALIDLFPTQRAYFFGIMTSLGYNPHDQAINFVTPVGIGNLVAGRPGWQKSGFGSGAAGLAASTALSEW